MPSDPLTLFLNQLMNIGDSTFTLLGIRRPGMSGSDASELGSSSDTTNQLKRNAINFARAYRDPSTDSALLKSLAGQVEASLLVEVTLSTISESEFERLVSSLYDLTDNRLS